MVLCKIYLLITIAVLSILSHSKINLKELILKQTPGRVLYTSQDGKISFYKKRNGDLIFLKNFKISKILSSAPKTHYLVIPGSDKKTFLLAKNEIFLSSNSILHPWEIFYFNAEDKSIRSLGKGLNPKIDFLNTWVIYYNPNIKRIYFKSLVNSLLDFNLEINADHSPFFIPEYMMLDNNQIIFSDENNRGHTVLLLFTRNTKETHLFYKPPSAGQRFELCKMNDQFYIGKFSLNGVNLGSQIIEFSLKNQPNYSKGKIIYESSQPDFGSLICSNKNKKIYFIKNYPTGESQYEYSSDVVFLNPQTRNITPLTKGVNISQIIEMDNQILTPHEGKFFIVEGSSTKDDSGN